MRKYLITFLLCTICLIANAKYKQTCKVKYKKNYEWSEYYTVDVTFLSGSELNSAIKTYDYDSYATYAVIFWDKDQVSIIKITDYTGCGTEVEQACIQRQSTNLEGEDKQGKAWEICATSYCY